MWGILTISEGQSWQYCTNIYHCVLNHTEVRMLLEVVKTYRQHDVVSSMMLDLLYHKEWSIRELRNCVNQVA